MNLAKEHKALAQKKIKVSGLQMASNLFICGCNFYF